MILEEAPTQTILDELARRFDATLFLGRRLGVHEANTAQMFFAVSGDPYLVIGLGLVNIMRLQARLATQPDREAEENG
mgnify:CR=1 FL=1